MKVEQAITREVDSALKRISTEAYERETSGQYEGKAGHLKSWLASKNKASQKFPTTPYVTKRRKDDD